MEIGSSFPIVSQRPSGSRQVVTVGDQNTSSSASTALSVPSSMPEFERLSQAGTSRFSKIEGLSMLAQQALSAYQSTESLSISNPRNQLIGVDVFA